MAVHCSARAAELARKGAPGNPLAGSGGKSGEDTLAALGMPIDGLHRPPPIISPGNHAPMESIANEDTRWTTGPA